MVSWDELQPLLFAQPDATDGSQAVTEARLRTAFEAHESNEFLNFRQFQAFLKDLELDEKAEGIDKFLYNFYFRRNCCLLLFGRCCTRSLRKVRMK